MSFDFSTLITDRTQADTSSAKIVLNKINQGSATAEEIEEFKAASLRGTYNYTDLNRVGNAISYIANRFKEMGYSVEVSPKTNWSVSEIPTRDQLDEYLSNVKKLREKIELFKTTTTLPESMTAFTYSEANNIEKILFDLNLLLDYIITTWFYSGEIYSGEV